MMMIRKSDLRAMWNSNLTMSDIARAFGVHQNTVTRTARLYGLPPKPRCWQAVRDEPTRSAGVEAETEEEITRSPLQPRPDFPNERDMEIIGAGGQYAALSILASRWRLPIQSVMARHHRLRGAIRGRPRDEPEYHGEARLPKLPRVRVRP